MSASMRKSKSFSNATNFRSKLGVSDSGVQADKSQRKMPSVGSNNQTSKLLPGLCPQTARGSLPDPGPSRIPCYDKTLSFGKASKAATLQDHTMDGKRRTNKSNTKICHEKRRGREDDKAQGSTLERHDKCRPVKGIRKSKLPVPTLKGKPAKLIIRKSATEGDLPSYTHKWTVITRYSSAPNLCGKAPSRIPVRIVKGSQSVGSVCMKKDPAHNFNCAKNIFGGRDLQSPLVSLRSTSIEKQSTTVSPPSGSAGQLVCGTLKMLSGNVEETGNLSDLEKDDNSSVVKTPYCVSHAEKSAVIQPPSISESKFYHHNTLNETVTSTGGGELSAISKIDDKPLTQSVPVVYHQSSILLLAVETDCSSDSGADTDTDTDKEKTFTSKSLSVKVDITESGGLAHKQSDPAMEQDSGIALSRSTLVPSQSASTLIVTHEMECSSESGSDGDVKQPEEEAHKANEWNDSTQSTAVISDQDGEEESELSCENTEVKDPDTSEFIRMCRTYDSAVFRFPAAATSGSFPKKRKTSRGKSIKSLNDSKSASRSSSDEESDHQRQQHPGEEEPLSGNPGKENTFLRCQNQLLRQTNSSLRADSRILLKRLEDEGNKGKLLEDKSCRLRTRVKCLKRKMKVVKTTAKKRPSDWKELVANLNGRATCSNLLVQNLRCLLKMPEETATEQNKKMQQVYAITDLQNTELKKATVFMALHKALQRLAEIVADQKNQLHLKDKQMEQQTAKLKRGSEIIAHQQLELKRVDGETVNLKNQLHLKDKQIKEQMEKLQREIKIIAQQELELKRADEETVNHLEAMQNKVLVVTQHEIALQEVLELLEKQKEKEGDLKQQVDSLQQNLLQVEERYIKEMNQNSVLQDQLTVVSNKYKICRRFEQETSTRNKCLEEELGALKETLNHLEAKQHKAAVVTQQENAVQENRELLEKQREREGDLEEQVASLQQNLLQVEEELIKEINQNSVLQDQLTVVSNMYRTCRRFEQEIATRNKCLEQEAAALKETVIHLEAKQNKSAVVPQQAKALQENCEKLEKQEETEGDLEEQVVSLQQNLLQVEEQLIKEINQNSVLQDQLTVVSNMYTTCRRFEQETATRNECLEQEAAALKETVIHLKAKQKKAAVMTRQENAVQEIRELLRKQEEREGNFEQQVASLRQNLLQVEEKLNKEINQNSLLQDQLTVVSTMYKNCSKFEEETATRNKCLENELEALKSQKDDTSSFSEKDNLVVKELLMDGNLLKPQQNQLFHVQDSHLNQTILRGTHCSSGGIERGYIEKLNVSEELINKELSAKEKAVNVKRGFPISTCEGTCAGEESENRTHAGLLSERQEESLVPNEAESAKKTEGNSSRFSVWLMAKCSRVVKQRTSRFESEGNERIQEKETEKKELRRKIDLFKREDAHKDKELDMMELSLEEIGKVKNQEIKRLKQALKRLQEENARLNQSSRIQRCKELVG